MELEMKSIKSAIAEVSTQECLVKRELEVMKHLYRGELEHIDSVSAIGSEYVNGENPGLSTKAEPQRTQLMTHVGCKSNWTV